MASVDNEFGIFGLESQDEYNQDLYELDGIPLSPSASDSPSSGLPKSSSQTQLDRQSTPDTTFTEDSEFVMQPQPKPKKYVPYTMKDYKKLKPVRNDGGLGFRKDNPEYQAALAYKQRKDEYNEQLRAKSRLEREMKASMMDPRTHAVYSPMVATRPNNQNAHVRPTSFLPASGNPSGKRQSPSPTRPQRLAELPPRSTMQRPDRGSNAPTSGRAKYIPPPPPPPPANNPLELSDIDRRDLFSYYERYFVPAPFLEPGEGGSGSESARNPLAERTPEEIAEEEAKKSAEAAEARRIARQKRSGAWDGATFSITPGHDIPKLEAQRRREDRKKRMLFKNTEAIRDVLQTMGIPDTFLGPSAAMAAAAAAANPSVSLSPSSSSSSSSSSSYGMSARSGNTRVPSLSGANTTQHSITQRIRVVPSPVTAATSSSLVSRSVFQPRVLLRSAIQDAQITAPSTVRKLRESTEGVQAKQDNGHEIACTPLAPSTQRMIAEDILDATVACLSLRHQRDSIDVAALLRSRAKIDAQRRVALQRAKEVEKIRLSQPIPLNARSAAQSIAASMARQNTQINPLSMTAITEGDESAENADHLGGTGPKGPEDSPESPRHMGTPTSALASDAEGSGSGNQQNEMYQQLRASPFFSPTPMSL